MPKGWEARAKSIGRFGQLDVFAADVYDVLLSKLFSKRTKDRDDLRALAKQIDLQVFAERMQADCQSFLADAELRRAAADNWYIVFGSQLSA